MGRSLRQRFGTIRWKLTWSYIWITLTVSILLTLSLGSALLGFGLNELSPPVIGPALEKHAVELTELVEHPDPAQATLALRHRFGSRSEPPSLSFRLQPTTASDAGDLLVTPPADFSGGPTKPLSETFLILLLDRDARIIGGSFPAMFVPGQPWSDPVAPEGRAVVERALAGGAEDELSRWGVSEWAVAAARPVRRADGTIIGALYVRTPIRGARLNFWSEIGFLMALTVGSGLISNGIIGLLFGFLTARGYSLRIGRLAAAAAAVAGGDLSPRVADDSRDEVGQLSRQFNAMADQLEANLRELRQLADRNAALGEQAAQLAKIEERNRLARELHDSVSQELFSVTMLAAAARNLVPHDPVKALTQLDQLGQTARHALQETRALIFALRPAALGDAGLAPALRSLASEALQRQGLEIKLRISGERRIPLEHEEALYRVVQEALANIAKHSGTHQAALDLDYGDRETRLSVSDRGRGFDPGARRSAHALGLSSMAERIAAIGGSFALASQPGAGTRIVVTLQQNGQEP